MLDCITIHAYIDTTVETACPTLIAMGFVYHTLAFCFGLANILPTSTDGTLKKKIKCFRYIYIIQKRYFKSAIFLFQVLILKLGLNEKSQTVISCSPDPE